MTLQMRGGIFPDWESMEEQERANGKTEGGAVIGEGRLELDWHHQHHLNHHRHHHHST